MGKVNVSWRTGDPIPSNIIVDWYGASNAVPRGWALCDGANGTPDLRDKFIVGAGRTYALNASGGAATHTLTKTEMPSHTHTVGEHNGGGGGGYAPGVLDIITPLKQIDLSYTGGSRPHNNLPPYYALFKIMKL